MRETADHVKYLRRLADQLKRSPEASEQLHLVADHLEELSAAILMNNRLIAMSEPQVTKDEVREIWTTIREIQKRMVTQMELEQVLMESR